MAKARIKKKPVKKISKVRKQAVPRLKKKIKEISSEIIFDSTVGKTDSLFVDVSAETEQAPVTQMPALQVVPNIYESPAEPAALPKKKSFWEKLFLFFSDN